MSWLDPGWAEGGPGVGWLDVKVFGQGLASGQNCELESEQGLRIVTLDFNSETTSRLNGHKL